jgi:hypothetical protein
MVRKLLASLLAAAGIMAVSAAGTTCRGAADAGAGGSPWEVMVWTGPLTVSLDTSSIAIHAARITARVLWDYAEAQHTRSQASPPYKSMIGVIVFDCAHQSFGGAGSVAYSGDGGGGDAVAQYSINPDNAPLSTTEPGTIGYDLVTFVCARAEHAPPAAAANTDRDVSSADRRAGSPD